MSKAPPLPKVAPVVQRTLLGVAIGAGSSGCKAQHVRIGQPPDEWEVRIGQPPPPEDVPYLDGVLLLPGGEPLADATITVHIAGEEALVTTDDEGRFSLDGLPPGATVEIRVEGYEPVWPARGEPESTFELVPVQGEDADEGADAPRADEASGGEAP